MSRVRTLREFSNTNPQFVLTVSQAMLTGVLVIPGIPVPFAVTDQLMNLTDTIIAFPHSLKTSKSTTSCRKLVYQVGEDVE